MQSNDTTIARKILAAKLKSLRLAYNVTQLNLMAHSGLSSETINRLEKGNKPWMIDSHISYVTSLKFLIETSKDYKKKVEKFKLPSIAELDHYFINAQA